MRMMMEEPMRQQFSLKARARAADYAPEQVVRRYMAVLGKMLRKGDTMPKIAQSNVFFGP